MQHLDPHLGALIRPPKGETKVTGDPRRISAIRPAVVNRKVWGDSRTQTGAIAQ